MNKRHGHASGGTPSATWTSWRSMHSRCGQVNGPDAALYIERGIVVCDRWSGPHGFENFLADMGERPIGKTLDRFPDRDGNYEPTNCRWATPTEQSRNNASCKLKPDDVQEILGRYEHGEMQRSIAARFGIKQATVSDIVCGRTWKDQIGGPT